MFSNDKRSCFGEGFRGRKAAQLISSFATLVIAGTNPAAAQQAGTPAIEEVASFTRRPTGLAVAPDGRLFVTLPYSPWVGAAPGNSVVVVEADGKVRPYPDATWNTPPRGVAGSRSGDVGSRFVNVQSNTVDSRGRLWLLDTGSPQLKGVVRGGAKLVAVDLASNRVSQVITFDPVVAPAKAFLNDVRVDAERGFAYITETGVGSLIVVDLRSGKARRAVTDFSWVTPAGRGPTVEGHPMPDEVYRATPRSVDGLALDATGEWLYLHSHPWLGRTTYRVPTASLRDESLAQADLVRRIEPVAELLYADGIQTGPDGAIYYTDVERNAVSRLVPGTQKLELVATDPRLTWPNSIAFGPEGGRYSLYVPAPQFHRIAEANGGVDKSRPPYRVYGLRRSTVEVPRPGASQRIDAIRRRGALRVAVLDEYPWLKRNPEGAGAPFQGPAWVLAEEYARRLGVRLETVEVKFANKVSILDTDGADITIAPLLRTPAREQAVDMISYSMAAHCVFGRADNPKVSRAVTLDDLDRTDITIGSIENTPQGTWLQSRLPKAQSRAVPGNIADLATDEVVSGRADVAPIDKFFFAGLAKRVPGLVTVPKGDACLASNELPFAIAMAVGKGQPAFIAWLRDVAQAIKPQVEAEQARVTKAGS